MINWKKKISYFILLPLVIGSWLMTFFRYTQMRKPEKNLRTENVTTIVTENVKEEHELLLNYEDPFLKKGKKKRQALNSKSVVNIEKPKTNIPATIKKINEKKEICRIVIHKNDYVIKGYKDEGILELVIEK